MYNWGCRYVDIKAGVDACFVGPRTAQFYCKPLWKKKEIKTPLLKIEIFFKKWRVPSMHRDEWTRKLAWVLLKCRVQSSCPDCSALYLPLFKRMGRSVFFRTAHTPPTPFAVFGKSWGGAPFDSTAHSTLSILLLPPAPYLKPMGRSLFIKAACCLWFHAPFKSCLVWVPCSMLLQPGLGRIGGGGN